MQTVQVQAPYPEEARCPKCGNSQHIRHAGPSANGHQQYDILSDTFGVVMCPACKHRAGWIEFHAPKPLTKPLTK
jgi:predicted nucleic-acid-binding Zn-ribbon protein